MTSDEVALLRYLGEEEYSQYGECHGSALDALVAAGLAQIHAEGMYQGGFIAKGGGPMYRAVSLTESGRVLGAALDRARALCAAAES